MYVHIRDNIHTLAAVVVSGPSCVEFADLLPVSTSVCVYFAVLIFLLTWIIDALSHCAYLGLTYVKSRGVVVGAQKSVYVSWRQCTFAAVIVRRPFCLEFPGLLPNFHCCVFVCLFCSYDFLSREQTPCARTAVLVELFDIPGRPTCSPHRA